MIRYLGEEPILDNLPTWLLADAEQREFALEHLQELVVKPTGESGGKGVFIGLLATEEQLAAQRDVLAEAPERWIAQQTVSLSTVPTALPDACSRPPRGPPPVRGLRGRDQDRARRPHPRGPARGLDDREQLAGRRLEGHMGACGRGKEGRGSAGAGRALAPPQLPGLRQAGWRGQQQQQQQERIRCSRA